MISKEKKQSYIKEMTTQFEKTEAVIVAHYQGLTVKQLDELRKKMRDHGIKFKITNKVTNSDETQTICANNEFLKKSLKITIYKNKISDYVKDYL